jgi:hypothetical protein
MQVFGQLDQDVLTRRLREGEAGMRADLKEDDRLLRGPQVHRIERELHNCKDER